VNGFLKYYLPWVIALFMLLIGGIADLAVYNGCSLVIIEDLHGLVKSLLGIQATVAVLSLSILTLLSSFVDKSYWGISISDFYTNRKNPKFNSFSDICFVLASIPAGLFLIIFQLYNFEIMLFIATVFIILWSAKNIYFIFRGEEAVKKDIESMYEIKFRTEDNINEKIILFKTYCIGWKSIVQNQSELDFQEYKDNYFKFYWVLIKEQNSDCMKKLCSITQQLIKSLLIASNDSEKKRGIKFLEELYRLMRYLKINDFSSKDFLKEFILVSEVIKEFLEALQTLSPKWIENNFDWYNFIGVVDTIAISFETKAKQSELIASQQISLQMGLL
jgi:hypothetical protein